VLTIPPKRLAFEAERAAEIQRADAALRRERVLWYFAAIGSLLAGAGIASVAFHVPSKSAGMVWLLTGTLIGEIGPLVIILIALHREES
jgi:hypothetical protein